MFDFFKKSRAFKFLCSACLLCSLGAFATFAEDVSDDSANEPATVGTLYYRANLGMSNKEIMMDEVKSNLDGTFDGVLKFKTSVTHKSYKKGDFEGTLDEAVADLSQNPPSDNSEGLISLRWTYVNNPNYIIWDSPIGTTHSVYHVSDERDNDQWYISEAWRRTAANVELYGGPENVLSAAGYDVSTSIDFQNISIKNPDEDAKLAFFLTLDDEYKAATKEIDLAENNDGSDSNPFELNDIQLYEATDNNIIKDESATEFSGPPGKYTVKAIVTKEGSTSIINGPVASTSDESA